VSRAITVNLLMRKVTCACLFITIGVLFNACANSKTVTYFNDLQEGIITSPVNSETLIEKGDILSIVVTSPNPEATAMFNAPNSGDIPAARSMQGNLSPASGYVVDQKGEIQFPGLGSIKCTGLTKEKLKDEIAVQLTNKGLLKSPLVTIRYLNYQVSVLGEVLRPGSITVANESISLLEALALVGDLTIYAKRDNVLLIRKEGDKTIFKRINLNSSEILSSPYYYLRSNDVLYVEANRTKTASASRTQQLLPSVLSALSFVAIILTRVIQ
jgi:polysaccharide biosynthesis/export protein